LVKTIPRIDRDGHSDLFLLKKDPEEETLDVVSKL